MVERLEPFTRLDQVWGDVGIESANVALSHHVSFPRSGGHRS